MLDSLNIKNMAVIDQTNASFGSGFNVLTGETGAGKSIVIGSVNMILGERSSRDMVRHGQQRALLQAMFSTDSPKLAQILDGLGLEADDGSILISREITADGKSTCRLGSQLTTSGALRELGTYLINIHGQHDNQMLLSAAHHIDFLDSFAGKTTLASIDKYKKLYLRRSQLIAKIDDLTANAEERAKRIELLQFQADEIKAAALTDGEEESLNEEYKVSSNAEHIIARLSEAYTILYDGETTVYDGLSAASKALEDVAEFDSTLAQNSETLNELLYSLSDTASQIRNFRDNLEFDPAYLAEMEVRLSLIFKLKRKYGSSIGEILAYYTDITAELDELCGGGESTEELQNQLESATAELADIGEKLTKTRTKAALMLKKLIEAELADLDMGKSSFEVNIISDGEFFANGMDKVEFLISANPGEPPKPLVKIASGGELSRVMLAIKSVLADSDEVETLIFDEIDTGVSGRAAQKIAQKLFDISRKKQVICITHLAQIACMADHHYSIVKNSDGDLSYTEIVLLNSEQRIDELSRIIGGAEITDTTRNHAKEMLGLAGKMKNDL